MSETACKPLSDNRAIEVSVVLPCLNEERTLAGWYLMSSEQLTREQHQYFRNAQPDSWPFADAALFYVPPDRRR